MKLIQERLKELLNYDPETGIFTWKVRTTNRIKTGDVAGSMSKRGYWEIKIRRKLYKAHRLAFLYMEGYFPENDIDHKDRNKMNNRWSNLREISQRCNSRNCKVRTTNKSGITGVSWNKSISRWVTQIHIPKSIHLGYFDNLIDAAKARWEAEVKYNFPNCNTTSSAYMYLKEKGAI